MAAHLYQQLYTATLHFSLEDWTQPRKTTRSKTDKIPETTMTMDRSTIMKYRFLHFKHNQFGKNCFADRPKNCLLFLFLLALLLRSSLCGFGGGANIHLSRLNAI